MTDPRICKKISWIVDGKKYTGHVLKVIKNKYLIVHCNETQKKVAFEDPKDNTCKSIKAKWVK